MNLNEWLDGNSDRSPIIAKLCHTSFVSYVGGFDMIKCRLEEHVCRARLGENLNYFCGSWNSGITLLLANESCAFPVSGQGYIQTCWIRNTILKASTVYRSGRRKTWRRWRRWRWWWWWKRVESPQVRRILSLLHNAQALGGQKAEWIGHPSSVVVSSRVENNVIQLIPLRFVSAD